MLLSLSADEWRRPTVHRDRDVKDLASHLLDTALRRIAMQRDGFFAESTHDTSFEGMVRFIQWFDVEREQK